MAVIAARLVLEELLSFEQAVRHTGYFHHEVLVKRPAGTHYDLHLSSLRRLFSEDDLPRP